MKPTPAPQLTIGSLEFTRIGAAVWIYDRLEAFGKFVTVEALSAVLRGMIEKEKK